VGKPLDAIRKPLAKKKADPSADNMNTATSTPAPAPRIIKFGFRDYWYVYTAKKRTAQREVVAT